jgi:hypothetical protein
MESLLEQRLRGLRLRGCLAPFVIFKDVLNNASVLVVPDYDFSKHSNLRNHLFSAC